MAENPGLMSSIAKYFDLQSETQEKDDQTKAYDLHTLAPPPGGSAEPPEPSHSPILPQYLAFTFGIIIEPPLRHYIENGFWKFDSSLLGWGLAALILGIILLPSVYKSSFDPKKPVVIQLIALCPMGMGWQSLFKTATSLAGADG
ncbi:hypothetical protein [Emcibacter sp.]|uniref:hypothetical protein n=1 Tax=Emcibacter sp. TaxID=1979954 RepID=UPI003A93DF95